MDWNSLNEKLGKAGGYAGLISAVLGIGSSILNGVSQKRTNQQLMQFNREEAEKQRSFVVAQTASANTWNEQMWEKTNEYNTPESQVQRLRDAGLNPLFYGLEGSAAGGLSAVQPLSYDRASLGSLVNPMSVGLSALDSFNNLRSVQKDIELKNAQIDKLQEDTEGVRLDNQWKDKTLDARTESERLGNELTKENIERIRKEKEQVIENIKKTIAETDNEIEKKALIQAQTALQKASEKEIIEMLPYKKLLSEAQTEAQKAAAAASYANAAYQRGLINNGYLDAMCDEMKTRVKNTEAQAAINDFKQAVKNGTYWIIESDDNIASKAIKTVLNGITESVSVFGEAIAGGFSGILH